MGVRRVVTGQDANGTSRFVRDDVVDGAEAKGVFGIQVIWAEDALPSLPLSGEARAPTVYYPPPGAQRFCICTLPPQKDSPAAVARLGPVGMQVAMAAVETHAGGGLFTSHHEQGNPGMHTTDTIDYGVILSGEVWLELDDAQEVLLKAGDTFVQNGTRHRWNNRGDAPLVMAVVLVGGPRATA